MVQRRRDACRRRAAAVDRGARRLPGAGGGPGRGRRGAGPRGGHDRSRVGLERGHRGGAAGAARVARRGHRPPAVGAAGDRWPARPRARRRRAAGLLPRPHTREWRAAHGGDRPRARPLRIRRGRPRATARPGRHRLRHPRGRCPPGPRSPGARGGACEHSRARAFGTGRRGRGPRRARRHRAGHAPRGAPAGAGQHRRAAGRGRNGVGERSRARGFGPRGQPRQRAPRDRDHPADGRGRRPHAPSRASQRRRAGAGGGLAPHDRPPAAGRAMRRRRHGPGAGGPPHGAGLRGGARGGRRGPLLARRGGGDPRVAAAARSHPVADRRAAARRPARHTGALREGPAGHRDPPGPAGGRARRRGGVHRHDADPAARGRGRRLPARGRGAGPPGGGRRAAPLPVPARPQHARGARAAGRELRASPGCSRRSRCWASPTARAPPPTSSRWP